MLESHDKSIRRKQPSFWFCMSAALVCLLAWVIFVSHLSYESMWIDETTTLRMERSGLFGLVQETAVDVHPPVYYMTVWAWVNWTGSENLFMIRLSSAIPALLAVAICFRIGREWFNSKWVGLGGAAFLATSGIFVYYSRDLRMYPLIVMWVALSWWLMGRMLRGKQGAALGYGAVLGLMAYTYYFSAFVVVSQALVVLLFFRNKLRQFLAACAIALLAFIPWIPSFLFQIHEAKAQSGNNSPTAPAIGKFLGTVPTSLRAIANFISTYTAKQSGYILILIVMALVLGLAPSVNRRYRQAVIALVLWLFLTVSLFFVINLAIPIYGLRYVLPIIPALALLAGVTIHRMPDTRARVAILLCVIIIGVLFHADGFLPPRTPHRELMQTLSQHYLPGDKIWYDMNLGARGSSIQDEAAYHLQFDAPNLKPDYFVWDAPNDYLDVNAVRRVWDVRPYFIPVPVSPGPAVGRVLTEDYQFDGWGVRLYESRPTTQNSAVFGDLFELVPGSQDRITYSKGESVLVKDWWRARQQPSLDYSYGLYLRRAEEGVTLADANGGLLVDQKPTSQLFPGEAYAFASQTFKLPDNLAPGEYDLWLGIYYWQNPTLLQVQAGPTYTIDAGAPIVRVMHFSVS
ncbi:MAG TPA: glycosyltransferase family 39 protein [Aggregatilineales bacterium]|nr:glycosyltransferase family 39 protein [Aggregatilineales bacterium]